MTPLDRAREAARVALEAEAKSFSDPVQYYVYREAAHRKRAKLGDAFYELDTTDDQFERESWGYLSNAAIDAFLSALVAEGMVLVPKTATEKMVEAAVVSADGTIMQLHLAGAITSHEADTRRFSARTHLRFAVWPAMIAAASQGEGT